MPIYQRQGERGDMYIQFSVDFPDNYFTNEAKYKDLEKVANEHISYINKIDFFFFF